MFMVLQFRHPTLLFVTCINVMRYQNAAGRVASAANSRLSPLPHEPAEFYDRNASVDIPLDSAAVMVCHWCMYQKIILVYLRICYFLFF